MATLANIATTLLAKAKSLEGKLTAKLGDSQAACDKLSEAAAKVEES